MEIYLPVAEVSVDLIVLLALGAFVFGVGGGFLMTPFLIFVGIPPAVAVASSANQLVGTSVSGVIGHWRRGNVDFKMGAILLAGGFLGSLLGVWIFGLLKRIGQVELFVNLCYIILLGSLGVLMLIESAKTLLRRRSTAPRRKLHQHTWVHGLPLKLRFRRSKLYISAFLPLGLGFIIGILSAVMGVGGGFVMVPAMIYLLGMPTLVVPGTSLFQIIFVAASVTVLQAIGNRTVDVLLTIVLLVGAVFGAQFGTRWAAKLRGEQLRGLLAILVLAVAVKLAADLTVPPVDLYSATVLK
jgi:uncharacterized membrane protein YfcA